MRVTLVYLHVVGKADPTAMDPSWYLPCAERFISTMKQFHPGLPHELVVVSCGGPINHHTVNLFSGVATRHYEYLGTGWDIGAYQAFASSPSTYEEDFMVFLATPCHFREHCWLLRLVQAFEKHGPGLYGPCASKENRPHIRTGCFACPPSLLRQYPVTVDSREKCFNFEIGCDSNGHQVYGGQSCFTDFCIAKTGLALEITKDAERDRMQWRTGEGIFRRGGQDNVLVYDRHTDIYDMSSPEQRVILEKLADNGHYP